MGVEAPTEIATGVSADDEIDYILRTIQFIESSVGTKVLAISIFPIYAEPFLFSKIKRFNLSESDKLKKIMNSLKNATQIPVFENSETYTSDLADIIVRYFG